MTQISDYNNLINYKALFRYAVTNEKEAVMKYTKIVNALKLINKDFSANSAKDLWDFKRKALAMIAAEIDEIEKINKI